MTSLTEDAANRFMTALPSEMFIEAMGNEAEQTITLTERQWMTLLAVCITSYKRSVDDHGGTLMMLAHTLTGEELPEVIQAQIDMHDNLVTAMNHFATPPIEEGEVTDTPVTITAPFHVVFAPTASLTRLRIQADLYPAEDTEEDAMARTNLCETFAALKPQIAALVPGFGEGLE